MKVQITKNHIKRGVAGSCRMCPIALAVHESLIKNGYNESYTVTVIGGDVSINYYNDYIGDWDSSSAAFSEVRAFVHKFDRELPVEPFEIELPERMYKDAYKAAA